MTHPAFSPELKFRSQQWAQQHALAMMAPVGAEAPIVHLLLSWVRYAESHEKLYGAKIGRDGVLGKAWCEIGRQIITLLNGSLGRLDGGTLDAGVRNFAALHGASVEAW